MFAAESNWVATLVLESVVAVMATGLALAAIVATANQQRQSLAWWLVLTVGGGAVAYDAIEINRMADPANCHQPRAFLSYLLAALCDCTSLGGSVRWARLVGESTGILAGVAMCAMIVLPRRATPLEVAERMKWIQRLLYGASLLFVAGIMMAYANFTWLLAHWDTTDEKIATIFGEVVRAGVVQSGVAYSALLAIFFLPARAFLGWIASRLVPMDLRDDADARKKWLVARDMGGAWQDDVRQILALLAPVLSAPVFDAIAKAGSK
jgi:hypothetical protein